MTETSPSRSGGQELDTAGEGVPRRKVVKSVTHSVEYAYSGPLPPPEVLRKFEEVLPGSAERIFSQFELQSAHRRAQESKVISAGVVSQHIGSVSGLLLGFIGVGGGIWLTQEGKSVAGLTALISTMTALVATFLYKKDQQGKELSRKQDTDKE